MQKEIKKEVIKEGVKIISTISFVLTGFFFIVGTLVIKLGESAAKMGATEKALLASSGVPLPSTLNLLIIGITFLVLAILFYFTGRDLLKSKKWAIVIAGILSLLVLLMSILSIFNGNYSSIITLAVSGTISWYLFFKLKK